jgi:molybdopterin synthase sulfur carrier subunit
MRDHPHVTVRLVYLARLREAFALPGEAFALTGREEPTVATLLEALRARGGAYSAELGGGRAVRVAVNHTVAKLDDVVRDGDEVALFPPVTGG